MGSAELPAACLACLFTLRTCTRLGAPLTTFCSILTGRLSFNADSGQISSNLSRWLPQHVMNSPHPSFQLIGWNLELDSQARTASPSIHRSGDGVIMNLTDFLPNDTSVLGLDMSLDDCLCFVVWEVSFMTLHMCFFGTPSSSRLTGLQSGSTE